MSHSRIRRLHKRPVQVEITAFLNLIVVLVPFLLSTAVFTRLAVLDLTLPAQSSGVLEKLKENDLKLEVVVRQDGIEVGDRIGGLIQRIPTTEGAYDVKALSLLMTQIKERFPDKSDVTVLAEPSISYDVLVHVMDAVRSGRQVQGATIAHVDLFPEISVGDAPIRAP